MNKKRLLIILLSLICLSFDLYYTYVNQYNNLNFVNFIYLLFVLTIYMNKYKNSFSKYKSIYNIFRIIINIFSSIILLYMCIVYLYQYLTPNIHPNLLFVFNLFINTFVLDVAINNIINIKKNTKNINCILGIIVLVIINLIYVRAFFEPNFSILFYNDYYRYIEQNYIYFFIMLFILEIQEYVNKKTA